MLTLEVPQLGLARNFSLVVKDGNGGVTVSGGMLTFKSHMDALRTYPKSSEVE